MLGIKTNEVDYPTTLPPKNEFLFYHLPNNESKEKTGHILITSQHDQIKGEILHFTASSSSAFLGTASKFSP